MRRLRARVPALLRARDRDRRSRRPAVVAVLAVLAPASLPAPTLAACGGGAEAGAGRDDRGPHAPPSIAASLPLLGDDGVHLSVREAYESFDPAVASTAAATAGSSWSRRAWARPGNWPVNLSSERTSKPW